MDFLDKTNKKMSETEKWSSSSNFTYWKSIQSGYQFSAWAENFEFLQISVGIKFQFKLTILIFWTKFA